MDIALSHKIHNRLDLSAEALECCRSHIVCLCLMLNVLENIIQSLEIDIVISLEGYSIHSLGRLVACRMGIEHRFITLAMYKGTCSSLIQATSYSLPVGSVENKRLGRLTEAIRHLYVEVI